MVKALQTISKIDFITLFRNNKVITSWFCLLYMCAKMFNNITQDNAHFTFDFIEHHRDYWKPVLAKSGNAMKWYCQTQPIV